MATSGRIETGRYNSTNHYVQWQLAGQNVGGNYSDVNWQAGINMSSTAYWYSNAIRIDGGNVDSQGIGNGTWSNISGTGDRQLRSGTVRIYHNSNGTKSFGAYINGWLYGGGNKTASGSWDLPNIPRHAVLNSAPNFNDEQNPTINYSNPAGTAVDVFLETPGVAGAIANRNVGSGGGGNYTFTLTEAERNTLRSRTSTTTSRTVRFVVHDTLGGEHSWSWLDRTMTIVNGEPVFSDFTYKDNEAAAVAVSGNDQILIQGKSKVRATVSVANRMVAQKSATNTSYTAAFDGAVNTQPYAAAADVNLDINTVAGSGVKALTVRATDSRGKQTAVSKDVTVIPYASPILNLEAARQNNFENATTLKIGGTFSRITIGGTDKNAITTGTLQYRTRQDGGTWSSWVTKVFTAGVGSFTTVDTNLSLVNSSAWDIEVKVSDKFETITSSVSVSRGVPLVMFSDNLEGVGVNRMPTAGRAVDVTGSIYSNDQKVATENAVEWVEIARYTGTVNTTGLTVNFPSYRYLKFVCKGVQNTTQTTENVLSLQLNGINGATAYSRRMVRFESGGAVSQSNGDTERIILGVSNAQWAQSYAEVEIAGTSWAGWNQGFWKMVSDYASWSTCTGWVNTKSSNTFTSARLYSAVTATYNAEFIVYGHN